MTALTVYEKMEPLAAVERLGEAFTKSGMFGVDRPAQGQVLALACITERKSPFELLRTYHIVHGRLTKRADAMLAEYRARGGKCKWLSGLSDCRVAKAHFTYGENDCEQSYTIEDAEREKLADKDNYEKSTPDMLRARLVSKVMRMIAPEIVAGVYVPEELHGAAPAQVTAEPLRLSPTPATSPAQVQPAPIEVHAETAPQIVPPWHGKLVKICEPHEAKVNAFLRGLGWLSEEQTFRALDEEQANAIVTKPEGFIARVLETTK